MDNCVGTLMCGYQNLQSAQVLMLSQLRAQVFMMSQLRAQVFMMSQ